MQTEDEEENVAVVESCKVFSMFSELLNEAERKSEAK